MNQTVDTNLLREKYRNNYDNARKNALIAIILTAVSLVLVAVMEYSFYFSAYVPVSWMEEGVATYKMDNDLYTDEDLAEMGMSEDDIMYYRLGLPYYQAETDGEMELVLKGGGALLVLAAFLICWLLSKKNPVWMMILTGLYLVDIGMMVPDLLDYYFVSDVRGGMFLILYHAWVLYYLVNGVISNEKLKKLPPPVAEAPAEQDFYAELQESLVNDPETDSTESEQ